MRRGGDLGHVVVDAGGEAQATVLDRDQFTVALHDHADGRRGVVRQRQRRADRALVELKLRRDGLPAGFLDEGGHGGRSQHRQLAAAHGLRCIFCRHAQRRVTLDTGGKHG